MWRKAMLYLGLGPDEEYDDYDPSNDDGHDRAGRDRGAGASAGGSASSGHPEEPSAIGAVRPISPRGDRTESGVQVQPTGAGTTARPRPQVVRPIAVTPNVRPHVVVPESFNEAQEVADKF